MSEKQESALWQIFCFIAKVVSVVAVLVYVAFSIATPWIVDMLSWQVTTNVQESLQAISTLLYAIPVVIVSAVFVGMLEGVGSIKRLNAIRVVSNSLVFIAPLIAWWLTSSLIWVMASLVLLRTGTLFLYVAACLPRLKIWFANRSDTVKVNYHHLLVSGGWMSVSSLLAPVLTTFDRYVVGALLSVSAVSYYATPTDMLMKLQVLSAALMSVLFPAFSASAFVDVERLRVLFLRGTLLLFMMMFGVAILVSGFATPLLTVWLDTDFALQSHEVLQWVAIGLLVNAMSFVPFGLLQAIGRADLTAKVNLMELPFYVLLLYVGLLEFGIVGAAIASTTRLTINSCILFALVAKLKPELRSDVIKLVVLMLFGVSVLLLVGML
jgi:O-antigen/teichoic acid export membrane protein